MNWGNKLLTVFVVFALMMGYLVYRCFQVPVNLVSTDYYKQELKYQDVIDQSNNAAALSTAVDVATDQNGNWKLQLPDEMKTEQVKGTVLLYCPADASRDRVFNLEPDGNAAQELAVASLPTGQYELKISWHTPSRTYYAEKRMSK